MAKFMITSIDWETDGEEVSLPTEEIVDGATMRMRRLTPCPTSTDGSSRTALWRSSKTAS